MHNQITTQEKISLTAERYLGFAVQKYDPENESLFVDPNTFNGCISFVRHVLNESGVIVPDFIGLDGERRQTKHVRAFFDHWGGVCALRQTKGWRFDIFFLEWKHATTYWNSCWG